MYFFILTIRISVRSGRLSACYSISLLVEFGRLLCLFMPETLRSYCSTQRQILEGKRIAGNSPHPACEAGATTRSGFSTADA